MATKNSNTTRMNQPVQMAIVEMELAGMSAKLLSMVQSMMSSTDVEFEQLRAIEEQITKVRNQIGANREMLKG